MNANVLLGMEERSEELNHILLEQGADFTISYTRVFKNNQDLEGYVLRNEDNNCSPTVYYSREWYDQDDLSVIAFLSDTYKKNSLKFDISNITDRDYVLSNIKPRLVSDKNLLILENKGIAHIEYLDMIVLFYIPIEDKSDTLASVQVTENLLSSANVSIDEAYDAAIHNLINDIEVKPLMEILCEDLGISPLGMGCEPIPMWVLTVKNKIQGAAAILCKSALKTLEEKIGGKIAILPSSIHEIIAVPYESEAQFKAYKSMVVEVNATQVEPADRLTDSVYFVDDGELRLAV